MRVLVATARNIRHYVHDEGIRTDIEAILTTHERISELINRQVVETSQLDTICFGIPLSEMEQLIQILTQWKNDAKVERDRLSLITEEHDG